jgi:hypothetical protein
VQEEEEEEEEEEGWGMEGGGWRVEGGRCRGSSMWRSGTRLADAAPFQKRPYKNRSKSVAILLQGSEGGVSRLSMCSK